MARMMERMAELHGKCKTGVATEADKRRLAELAAEFEEIAMETMKAKETARSALRTEVEEKVMRA